MFVYEKKLEYPVRIRNANPALAKFICSQYGGPEGKSTVDFATETVTKGNVSNFITATGTIEPVRNL